MQKIAILALVASILPSAWSAADACGDKFLLVGRGPKFQRAYAAIYPGNVLVYAHAHPGSTAAIHDVQLQKDLKQSGHRVVVVEDRGLFEQALQSGGFDIVLADVADAPALDAKVAASPSSPTVLYVMDRLEKAQADALQQQYHCQLKASDKPNCYLTIIDDAMKTRVLAGRAVSKR